MKGLTLWQPWATLIALGHKRFETRSWGTRYGGPIAIHSAARKMRSDELELLENLNAWHGLQLGLNPDSYPLGVIVCTAQLVGCQRMDVESITVHDELEYDVGAWELGRYAWELTDVHALATPVPMKGAQGLWDVPPHVQETMVRAQARSAA